MRVVEHRFPHQLDRFLCSMIVLVVVLRPRFHCPQRGLGSIATPIRGRAFADTIEATSMLQVIVSPRQGMSALGPDELTPQLESTFHDRLLDLAPEQTRIPDIDHRSRKQ